MNSIKNDNKRLSSENLPVFFTGLAETVKKETKIPLLCILCGSSLANKAKNNGNSLEKSNSYNGCENCAKNFDNIKAALELLSKISSNPSTTISSPELKDDNANINRNKRKSLLPHPVNRSSTPNGMLVSPHMDKSPDYTNIQGSYPVNQPAPNGVLINSHMDKSPDYDNTQGSYPVKQPAPNDMVINSHMDKSPDYNNTQGSQPVNQSAPNGMIINPHMDKSSEYNNIQGSHPANRSTPNGMFINHHMHESSEYNNIQKTCVVQNDKLPDLKRKNSFHSNSPKRLRNDSSPSGNVYHNSRNSASEKLGNSIWELYRKHKQTQTVYNMKMALRDKLHEMLLTAFPREAKKKLSGKFLIDNLKMFLKCGVCPTLEIAGLEGHYCKKIALSYFQRFFMFRLGVFAQTTATCITALLKHFELYIACGLYVVGSSMTGLGAKSSDMDMCLMLTHDEIDQEREATNILHTVRDVFLNCSFLRNVEVIYAKVPILRFTDCVSGIEVDLNVNNAVGIRNTQLLSSYARFDERFPPLVLLVKMWARHHGINDAKNNSLSSYSLVLMVIHFLQYGVQPPVLPCLQQLQQDKYRPNSDVQKLKLQEDLPEFTSENTMNVGDLFIGFLNYFSHEFDYFRNVMSVRLGGIIPKEIAMNNTYSAKNKKAHWKWVCIEEPFDLTNTACAVFKPDVFRYIRQVFSSCCAKIKRTFNLGSILQ